MTELLPCPFCGGEAQYSEESRFHICWVYCFSCGAASGYRNTEAEAIDAWNTRAERTTTMTTDEGSQNWYSCDTCYADGYAAALPSYCPNCGARVVGGDAK